MPVCAITRKRWRSSAASSSFGVTNLSQRWVPRGSQRSTYSAPTIASAKLLSVRLMVAAIIIHLLVLVLFQFFQGREARRVPAEYPLAVSQGGATLGKWPI